jgi:hypothetical protein
MAVYNGTVTDVQFSPMVVIHSYLHITVDIPAIRQSHQFEMRGTIEELSNRFGFIIVEDDHWDLRPMFGRACQIDVTNGNYTFLGYV